LGNHAPITSWHEKPRKIERKVEKMATDNGNSIPSFYLKIEEGGKVILSFRDTNDWLHGMLWNAFKAAFLRGMRYGPDDFNFLRTGVSKMLKIASKHFHQNSEGEFVLKAEEKNLTMLSDIVRAAHREIVSELRVDPEN
jgi:hypothetical protein